MAANILKLVGDNTSLLEQLLMDPTELRHNELAWRDRCAFLLSKGYSLRPRYQPDWTPSWTLPENKDIDPWHLQDFHALPVSATGIDALRVSDNMLVYIKRVVTGSHELEILKRYSEAALAANPSNPVPPILDSFVTPEDQSITYIVMPFLRPLDNPEPEKVGDIVDLVDQVLKGLVFMHGTDVAVGDINRNTGMMDAAKLYCDSFHPVLLNYDITGRQRVKPLPRSLGSVKYYFTNFALSLDLSRLPAHNTEQVGRPLGQAMVLMDGMNSRQDAPELSFGNAYDPYKVDIYTVGVMLGRIAERYSNLDFLKTFAKQLTQIRPISRPNAEHTLQSWQTAKAAVSREQRLRPVGEPLLESLIRDGIVLLGQLMVIGGYILSCIEDGIESG